MRWSNPGHEFDVIASTLFSSNIIYYLYGWGLVGKNFYKEFKNKINIIGAIDKKIVTDDGSNLRFLLPEEIDLKKDEKIIITTGWIQQVREVLDEKGYKYREDYYLLEEFSSIYNFYKYGIVHLENIALVGNEKCTLRCKKCVSLIPYNKKQVNFSFSEMKDSIDVLLAWVDSIGILAIGGGDMILNPDLKAIIEYIGDTYNTRIGRMELYTNAIIMPSDELMKVLQKYNVVVRFTDYSKHIPGRQKIEEIHKLCNCWGIDCEHVKFDYWVDSGFPQESNGLIEEEDLILHCEKCKPTICTNLVGSKLFYCTPAAMAHESGLYDHDEDDYFELADFNPDRKLELLEFYNGYSKKGYPSHCKRCNGLFNTNKNRVEVAEQIRYENSYI